MRNIGTLIAGLVILVMVGAGVFFLVGGTPQGVITTPEGSIVIEFFPDAAPRHVESWKDLARDGFYDGTTFHRTVPGFMIQGGDPNSKDSDPYNDGFGGPGYYLDEEFSTIHHERGIVSMARGPNVNSAGSQFFICLADLPMLDRQYTVFGRVVEGMDVVDAIAVRPTMRDDPRLGEHALDPVPMEEVTVRTVYRLPLLGEIVF